LAVAIGRAFEIPSWFGANLDALYDSLNRFGRAFFLAPVYVVVL